MMDAAFIRTSLMLGPDAMERLRQSRVCVFGIGGVGGHVVEVLARSGVGAIDLVDADVVDITNLNRQIIALRSTLGRPKVEVAAERIRDINPACQVTPHRMFYLPENAETIDLAAMDYVVDCIDTMTAKLDIVRRCHEHGIPVISSMGTARKLQPELLRVSDITKTHTDPLARVLRRKLREMGIPHLKCVWSTEAPCPCPPDAPLPSNAFVPATAGLLLGSEVVRDLCSSIA